MRKVVRFGHGINRSETLPASKALPSNLEVERLSFKASAGKHLPFQSIYRKKGFTKWTVPTAHLITL